MKQRNGLTLVLALLIVLVLVFPVSAEADCNCIPLAGYRQRISFDPWSTSYTFSTSMTAGNAEAYLLYAHSGQTLYVTLQGNAQAQVYSPSDTPLTGIVNAGGPWSVPLWQNGDYTLALLGDGWVTVTVSIPAGGEPVPPTRDGQRIYFAAGATSASVYTDLGSNASQTYVLRALATQSLFASINGNASLTVMAPDGNVLPGYGLQDGQVEFSLPLTGDYTLVVNGSGGVWLTVSIPALEHGAPNPVSRTRISFARGAASTTISRWIYPGAPQGFVLRLLAYQRLYVQVTDDASVSFRGPGNQALAGVETGRPGLWTLDIPYTGDYTAVVAGNGNTGITFYVPPLQ